jgi:two-component system phosphate regulon response regulator OmpR
MADSKPKILVVDDDLRLRDLLRRYLTQQGFVVQAVADGTGLQQVLAAEPFDVLVLDWMLPGEDGLTLCRRLRAAGSTLPIILLTARVETVDRVLGLELGADDYVSKPFDPRERVARIHALLRRCPPQPIGAPVAAGGVVRLGHRVINLENRTLTGPQGTIVLTTTEFALLKVLLGHSPQPVSRDTLMTLIYGQEYLSADRRLDMLVSRLRRLIELDPRQPRYLQTVRGHGYVLLTT